ncbi:phosphopantetheine-binding protein [Ruminiclostridium josui]|uniref:phosphopantetheine-binding protein n=1 Tax=Ruminiclostridium josui TaxID=1499 RepID=UPI001FA760A9|nr:phosphopantetheine-binding protein [Ruminiclostridium josui]
MDYEVIKEKVRNVLQNGNYFENCGEISFDTKVGDLFNSITFIKFLVSLEQEFDIEFDDDDLTIDNIDDLNFVVERIYEMFQTAK